MKKIMFKTKESIRSGKENFKRIKSIFRSEVINVFALSILITSTVMAVICIIDFLVLKLSMKLSITLDTLTARILKLSSDSQSRIEPVPFYSWWDATDRRADSAVAPVAHEISPDHRF